jgi:DNA mismatch repair protein MutL
LAYPEIRFSVYSEGRQIFATPGDGQLSSVLIEIYGLQVAEQMVPISSLDGKDDERERPVVSGYTSLPTCFKSTRQHMSFFVNRRWVLSRMLSYAVEEAYHSLLLTGRHPIAVVNIAVDPTQIDVNVHPAKTEIRFLKERRVFSAIMRAVRQAVLEDAEIPRWGNDRTHTQGAMNRAPTSNVAIPPESFELDIDIEEEIVGAQFIAPSNEDESPIFPQDNPWLTVTEEETGTKPPSPSRLWQSHIRGLDLETGDTNIVSTRNSASSEHNTLPTSLSWELTTGNVGAPLADARSDVGARSEVDTRSSVDTRSDAHARLVAGTSSNANAQPDTPDIPSELTAAAKVSRLPALRVVGQLSQSYIVTEGPDGMYLIDQHAAHERILLERMVAALQARTPLSQLLLTPIHLELSPAELEAIEEHLQRLEHIGFTLEMLENSTLQVRAVPNVLIKQMNARSLHDLLTELTAPEHLGHTETWEEHALANVACKAAIKANYFLTVSEMREMIEQLERTNAPYSCCHGRPTMIHFSLSALEREFGRR